MGRLPASPPRLIWKAGAEVRPPARGQQVEPVTKLDDRAMSSVEMGQSLPDHISTRLNLMVWTPMIWCCFRSWRLYCRIPQGAAPAFPRPTRSTAQLALACLLPSMKAWTCLLILSTMRYLTNMLTYSFLFSSFTTFVEPPGHSSTETRRPPSSPPG